MLNHHVRRLVLIRTTDVRGRIEVTVPGARFGMSRWRYNNPITARRVLLAAILTTGLLLLATAVSFELGGRLWLVPLLVLALAGIPFGLVLYFTGPNSGWRGAWWIRLPRRLEELLPQIQTALQDAGLSARPTRPGPKSRWLRNTQVSLELDRGICIWLLPGVPGSRAGLSPRLQPLTTLVITGLADPSSNQSDHLREVLQRAGENPTWGP